MFKPKLTKFCSNCHIQVKGDTQIISNNPLGLRLVFNKCLDLFLAEKWTELESRAIEGYKDFENKTKEKYGIK